MASYTKGLAIVVRPAASDDIPAVVSLDHSSTTDYVWQMDMRDEGTQTQVTFRRVRLPRAVKVTPPRDVQHLVEDWKKKALFIVAEVTGELKGYLAVSRATLPEVAMIADCAVDRSARRQGIGTALVTSATDWARRAGLQRLIIETQARNHATICFCRKNGFTYCGYNDLYYPNQDIALFFGMALRRSHGYV